MNTPATGGLRVADQPEFIEEWRHTIANPPTADLLDMVRSFRATTKVTFRQELVEKSGDKASIAKASEALEARRAWLAALGG